MKTLVIICHPNMENSQVNKAWMNALRQKPETITIHELYKVYPNGKIDVSKEQSLVESHSNIVFQFPFYWFSSPPLLKQWQDDVLAYGWAYGSKGKNLHGKQFGLAISMGGTEEDYNKISISKLIKPFEAMSAFVGMHMQGIFTFYGASGSIRKEILDKSSTDYLEYILKFP